MLVKPDPDVGAGCAQPVAVAFENRRDRPAAEALAARLGLPVARRFRDPHPLLLELGADGRLGVRVARAGHPLAGGRPVVADLLALDTGSPAGRKLNTPFFKAVGVRRGTAERPRVLDGTAGLGEDAWLLASAGCRVDAFERNPVVLALLEDALARAAAREPGTAAQLTARGGEALDALRGLRGLPEADRPDTVYLDPMFPPGRRATERKAMRVVRMLEEASGGTDDEAALLAAARAAARRRVAVKRPSKAPPLAGVAPDHAQAGKAVRFDVYLTPRP